MWPIGIDDRSVHQDRPRQAPQSPISQPIEIVINVPALGREEHALDAVRPDEGDGVLEPQDGSRRASC